MDGKLDRRRVPAAGGILFFIGAGISSKDGHAAVVWLSRGCFYLSLNLL
jgi:hypothetical protein